MTRPRRTGRARRVVVAVDGSPASATALPWAQAVASQLGARVQVLYVAAPGEELREPSELLGLSVRDADIDVRFETGEPVEAILRAVADPAVSLVALATHGHDVRRGQRLATVPRRVIARAAQPILLIRPEAAEDHARPLKRLLVPLDGTPTTTAALAPAMRLAGQLGAAMDLLHVMYPFQPRPEERGSIVPPAYLDQPQYEWPAWRAKVATWVRSCCETVPRDAEMDVFLARGRDADEIGVAIARFAAEHHDDAIVLVRRSRLEAGRARILGHLLDEAPCPLLLVEGPVRASPPRREARRATAPRTGDRAGVASPSRSSRESGGSG